LRFDERLLQTLSVLIAFCFSSYAFALDPAKAITQYSHEIWQAEQGLPVSSVASVLQTSSGYLWLGTEEGLVRFDGTRFKIFDRTNTKEITTQSVVALCEDHQKNLWIGTYGGGLLRMKDDQFQAFTTHEGLSNDQVTAVYEDRKGNLWIGTDGGGINVFKDGKFTIYTTQNGLANNSVFSIYEDPHGTLWIGTRGGLNQFQDGKIKSFSTPEGAFKFSVRSIAADRSGNILIGTSDGLHVIRNNQITTYTTADGLPTNKIWVVKVDKNGCIWIGTYGAGLARLVNGKISVLSQKEGLSNDFVLSIFEDVEGSVWIGTNAGGLNRFKDSKFTSFTTKEGLSDDLIWSIYEDSGRNLWIGTDSGGLNKYSNGQFSHLTMQNGLSSNRIFALFEDRDGYFWLGAHSVGLNRFKEGKIEIFTKKDGLAGDLIQAIYQDHSGDIWIGTSEGLNKYSKGKFTTFTTKDGLCSDRIRPILETSDGLWIGTRNGLNLYKDGKFIIYNTSNGLSSNFITCLYSDDHGNLWIGTGDGGLIRYKDKKFINYTTQTGLFDDLIFQILDDHQGRLWMSCNKGVFSVRIQDLDDFASGKISKIESIAYGTADGMKSRECNGGPQPAGCRTRDGKLWFPTLKGIAMIDPKHLEINTRPPAVHIEDVIIDERPLLTSLINSTVAIVIPPGKGKLEFHYAGLSFLAPSKVRYKYKLGGFDDGWIEAEGRRVAYYTNIPPGKYTFHVIACNNDGVWNESGAALRLTLQPHFYQSPWFYSLGMVSLFAIAWAIHRYRIARLIEIERVRTRIATDLHDDIGSGLSQIAILSEVARRKVDLTESHIGHELKNIAAASRELVDSMSDIVWAVNPGKDHLGDLVQRMRRFASDVLTARNITFRFESTVTAPERRLNPDIRRHFFLIFKEALNNMIRHSQCTTAEITLQNEANFLVMKISDNGKGFDLPETTHGQGLRNMRKRASEMNGKLQIQSVSGQGTTLVLKVPLIRNFFLTTKLPD
jgi:ligand-binding sensor domain-containing protein/signal transduction histidine kinase